MNAEAYLEHFRAVFDDQEAATQLKDHIYKKVSYNLLCLTGALTEGEWREVEEGFDSGRDRAREVMRRVRKKNQLQCYLGFSNVIWEQNGALGKKLFPFTERLKEPLKRRGGTDGRKLVLPHECRSVLWLAASSADLESISLVLDHFGCKCSDPVKTFNRFQYKTILFPPGRASTPVQLCVACLPGEYLSAQAVSTLAKSIQPQPWLAMLSGTCTADEATARLGDIAVIRRDAVSAELQHVTELWRLQEKALWLRDGLLRERRPSWSPAEQSLVLARLYLELNLEEEQQSQWFKDLTWDASKAYSDNHKLRQYVPQPEAVWKNGRSRGQWKDAESDVLPFAPCASLLSQAAASLLYAHCRFPLPRPSDPGVVFSKASLLTGVEGAVCCPEAVKFYNGIKDAQLDGLNYFAAIGVSQLSGEDSDPGYLHHSSCGAAVYTFQVLKYHVKKIQ